MRAPLAAPQSNRDAPGSGPAPSRSIVDFAARSFCSVIISLRDHLQHGRFAARRQLPLQRSGRSLGGMTQGVTLREGGGTPRAAMTQVTDGNIAAAMAPT